MFGFKSKRQKRIERAEREYRRTNKDRCDVIKYILDSYMNEAAPNKTATYVRKTVVVEIDGLYRLWNLADRIKNDLD